MRWLVLLLGVAGAQPTVRDAPGVARPGADVPVSTRTTLLHWFRGYEFVPTAAHFARLDGVGEALRGIAVDSALHPVVRARALSSLVHAPEDASGTLLAETLIDGGQPAVLRRTAARALAEDPRHLDLLVSVAASDPDVLLREACARGLREMGPEAHAARDILFRAERAPTVRALLGETKEVSR